jgi:hypothetical protein
VVRRRPSTGRSLGDSSIELMEILVALCSPDSRSARRIDLPPVEGVLGLEENGMALQFLAGVLLCRND